MHLIIFDSVHLQLCNLDVFLLVHFCVCVCVWHLFQAAELKSLHPSSRFASIPLGFVALWNRQVLLSFFLKSLTRFWGLFKSWAKGISNTALAGNLTPHLNYDKRPILLAFNNHNSCGFYSTSVAKTHAICHGCQWNNGCFICDKVKKCSHFYQPVQQQILN